ncbi:MAG TPA: NUDIX domain-containing protein [Leifsonia sp.]|jgi:8-oxo-dGTP pyrophosphatase MutT (NUDIX family)|nr:NUDIX domain-containing protein [Leifsonia sp.]
MVAVATIMRRQVFWYVAGAPVATVVVPSVRVVAFSRGARLLLVQRSDSGVWELPGGKVDVGESADSAAIREVLEEAGMRVRITGLVGVFSDPGYVIRDAGGATRQPFEVVLRAEPLWGNPHGDQFETRAAAWVSIGDLHDMEVDPASLRWIGEAFGRGVPAPVG